MAIVVLEVNRKPQQGCKCGAQGAQQAAAKPDAAKVQPVMQTPVMPPSASPATEKTKEWSLSYAAWLALLSVVGGIVIISQTK